MYETSVIRGGSISVVERSFDWSWLERNTWTGGGLYLVVVGRRETGRVSYRLNEMLSSLRLSHR